MNRLVSALAGVILAALKEFWFDARYEVPHQSARDNWQDFAGYVGGILLGLVLGR